MNSIFKLFTPMAVAALLSLPAAAIRLDATNSIMMMKPLQGITFDVGTKRAVSYFLSVNGTCKLVLTLAETIGPDDQVPNAESTRFEAANAVMRSKSSLDGKRTERRGAKRPFFETALTSTYFPSII